MRAKPRKLSTSEIAAFEAKRDIGAEILQSIRDMKAGKGMLPESPPRIRVDFNEFVASDLVLLSKTDPVECDDGSKLLLQVAMPVIAFECNVCADGKTEYLYVRGYAERNDPAINGEWTRSAQWCCRFADGVQISESRYE